MNDDPQPSLDPTSFSNKLIAVLQKYREENRFPEEAMTSLVLRYNNSWIDGIFSDFEDNTPGLMDRLRVNLKCAVADHVAITEISNRIDPQPSIQLSETAKNALDYSQEANIVQIGNVTVAFILLPIRSDGSVIR